jgi:hypothetical protein
MAKEKGGREKEERRGREEEIARKGQGASFREMVCTL